MGEDKVASHAKDKFGHLRRPKRKSPVMRLGVKLEDIDVVERDTAVTPGPSRSKLLRRLVGAHGLEPWTR